MPLKQDVHVMNKLIISNLINNSCVLFEEFKSATNDAIKLCALLKNLTIWLKQKSLQILDLQAFKAFGNVRCSTYGNRTRDSSVKGRRLNPLTNAPFVDWDAKVSRKFYLPNKILNIFVLASFVNLLK
jgi:hypothetical protein